MKRTDEMTNYTEIREGRSPKEQMEFLSKEGNMNGRYLSECLDSSRWGSIHAVMYEMGTKDMVSFVQNWMNQNEGNFGELYYPEKWDKNYNSLELPHINNKECPRNTGHKGKVLDLYGVLRCAHMDVEKFKPNYTESFDFEDNLSQTTKKIYLGCRPRDKWMDDYNKEEPSLVVKDYCHAIISDKNRTLPLETIIKRLNRASEERTVYCDKISREEKEEIGERELEECNNRIFCRGHRIQNKRLVFGLDGLALSMYVKKWNEQDPDGAPLFEN